MTKLYCKPDIYPLKLFSSVLALVAACQIAWAASVSGKLVDETNQPVAFANLVLIRMADSARVKLAVSTDKGEFLFNDIQPGRYQVMASMIGYKTTRYPAFNLADAEDKQLGTIKLPASDLKLNEVTVETKKPMITVQPDKTIVNVADNPLMINDNALEILRKSPGVMVNQDEQIFLQGRNGLLIFIDGRQSPLSERDLANWLKTIPASQIESIEIITNPSAKYDAAGNAGIINIRLKKSKETGLNGSLTNNFSHGFYNETNNPRTNHAININYGAKRWNVFANYGYDYTRSWSFFNTERAQNGQFFDQKSENRSRSNSNNFKVGSDIKVGARHTFGVMADGNLNTTNAQSESRMQIFEDLESRVYLQDLLAENDARRQTLNMNFNANHLYKDTSGLEITTDANYGIFELDNRTRQPNFYVTGNPPERLDRSFGLETPTNIGIAILKTDVEKRLGKSVLSGGYKISHVETRNTFRYKDQRFGRDSLLPLESSDFRYRELVSALYVQFRHKFNDEWNMQAGLRVENTNSIGTLKSAALPKDSTTPRNYTDPFPSAGITYTPNKSNSLTLSYSRRIDRPVYQFLNPFQFRIDELSYEQGNPFLNPQYTNNFQLSHTFMYMLTTSVGYSHTKEFFARIIDSLGNATFLTRRNLADVKTFNLNISSPLPISKWWNGYFNFSYNHQLYRANFGPQREVNINIHYYNIFMQHNITLSKSLSFVASGFYASPNVWGGTFRNRQIWNVEAGLQKKVLDNKATLSLAVSDLFLSMRWQGINEFGGLYVKASGGWESRQLKLGFNYRFGRDEKKIFQRKRNTNLEERKRLNPTD